VTSPPQFFLEVCVYALICKNSEQLFAIGAGDTFECRVSAQGLRALREWLTREIP
jgi:hypothetical protein